MHLSPADTEKLLMAVAGMVARDRLARGVRLNHPEAVALLSTWVVERAREGALVADLMESGRHVLTREQVMPGVAEMLHDVQVEATFPDGRKLVTLHHPVQGPTGEPGHPDAHAAPEAPKTAPAPDTGSAPDAAQASEAPEADEAPGAVRVRAGTITLNADRTAAERLELQVENTGDRPVQIGSHLHLPDANPALVFDRAAAHGFRLDVPAGTSVRFEPGVARSVAAVALRGQRRVPGLRIDRSALGEGGSLDG
ncbi:urease subunit gamma [Kineococcus sp. SYSU DK006]|uniref:urease subunit gamma n=1 Tax=Kineococcus sp. SYSU DK006 TaxID=3383127 RepID=UPI003D7DC4FA